MAHFKNFIDGFSSLFTGLTNHNQYYIERHGFQKDRKNLQADTHQVFKTLNRNIQKAYTQHGFQTR